MSTNCSEQLTFWELGSQQVTADFAGGRVVADARLLPLRLLDKQLGVLSTIAQRLPDPRTIAQLCWPMKDGWRQGWLINWPGTRQPCE
jgi:hypothetical protein